MLFRGAKMSSDTYRNPPSISAMMNKTADRTSSNSEPTAGRFQKPYMKPLLVNLGSLKQVTKSKKTSGAIDGSKRNRFTRRGGVSSGSPAGSLL